MQFAVDDVQPLQVVWVAHLEGALRLALRTGPNLDFRLAILGEGTQRVPTFRAIVHDLHKRSQRLQVVLSCRSMSIGRIQDISAIVDQR